MRSRICFSSAVFGSIGKMAFVGLSGHSLIPVRFVSGLNRPLAPMAVFHFNLQLYFSVSPLVMNAVDFPTGVS